MPNMTEVVTKRRYGKILTQANIERFCNAYLFDCNESATKAALSIGYSKTSASILSGKILTRPDVISRIAQLRASISQSNDVNDRVSKDKILDELDAAISDATAKGDHSTRVRAIELKGKTIGLFKDNQNVDVIVNVVNNDELAAINAIASARLMQLATPQVSNTTISSDASPTIDAQSKPTCDTPTVEIVDPKPIVSDSNLSNLINNDGAEPITRASIQNMASQRTAEAITPQGGPASNVYIP